MGKNERVFSEYGGISLKKETIIVRQEQPEDYPQFGFVEAGEFGITTCDGYNFPAFMAMELKPGYLDDVTGKYYETPIYDDELNTEAAKAYDDKYFQ